MALSNTRQYTSTHKTHITSNAGRINKSTLLLTSFGCWSKVSWIFFDSDRASSIRRDLAVSSSTMTSLSSSASERRSNARKVSSFSKSSVKRMWRFSVLLWKGLARGAEPLTIQKYVWHFAANKLYFLHENVQCAFQFFSSFCLN